MFAELSKRLNADLVKKVGCTYRFDVEGGGKKKSWLVDLKSGGWLVIQLRSDCSCALRRCQRRLHHRDEGRRLRWSHDRQAQCAGDFLAFGLHCTEVRLRWPRKRSWRASSRSRATWRSRRSCASSPKPANPSSERVLRLGRIALALYRACPVAHCCHSTVTNPIPTKRPTKFHSPRSRE